MKDTVDHDRLARDIQSTKSIPVGSISSSKKRSSPLKSHDRGDFRSRIAGTPGSTAGLRLVAETCTSRNRRTCPQRRHPDAMSLRKEGLLNGGECGIRTHGRFPYTRFPSVRLRPLGQLSAVLANGVAGSRAARKLAQGLGNQTVQVPAEDEQLRSQRRSSVSRPISRFYIDG